MTTTKTAKCPNCLPDSAGAIFSAYGANEWKCNNCGHRLPRRTNKPQPKITPSMQNVLDALKNLGWNVETSFIGRKLWVTASHPTRNWVSGNTLYGTVGVRGDINLKLQRLGTEGILNSTSDIHFMCRG